MKDKINELVTKSKNKTVRDFYGEIHEFQRVTNPVENENGDLLAVTTTF
jgi:hypothetical protein